MNRVARRQWVAIGAFLLAGCQAASAGPTASSVPSAAESVMPSLEPSLPPEPPKSGPGLVSLLMEDVPDFDPIVGGRAECTSVANGDTTASIFAREIGTVDSRLLLGTIAFSADASAPVVALFTEDRRVRWEVGEATNLVIAPDGMSGSFQFEFAQSSMEAELDPTLPNVLAGRLVWSCGPWQDPTASLRPDGSATVWLKLDGVDWTSPEGGVNGTCTFEADGSVAHIAASAIGVLQTLPARVQLELPGISAVGDHVLLTVWVEEPGFGVMWMGPAAVITELGNQATSGQASFVDLPNDAWQARPDWPPNLDGRIDWQCD